MLLELDFWDHTFNPYPQRLGVVTTPPLLELPPLPEEDRLDLTHLPAFAIDAVDTTGAGDLFAAGFLAGHIEELDVHHCLELGAAAAAEVISHWGARPEQDLKLIRAKLGR